MRPKPHRALWGGNNKKKAATASRAVATTRLAAFFTRPQAETKSAQAGCKRRGGPLVKDCPLPAAFTQLARRSHRRVAQGHAVKRVGHGGWAEPLVPVRRESAAGPHLRGGAALYRSG